MKFFYYLLPIIAGAGMTIQIGLNTKLRMAIDSQLLSSLISFMVGSMGLAFVFLLGTINGSEVLPVFNSFKQVQWWMYMGGLFGAFYVFTTIVTSPKIGFVNMFSLVVAGQMILAIIVDHYGILGTIHTINPIRILGIVFLMVGAYIIQTH